MFASTRQIYGRPRYLPVDEEHPSPGGRERDQQDGRRVVPPPLRAGLRPAGRGAPADQHVWPADARQGRAPDVPRVLAAASSRARNSQVYGDGEQRRDFNYVDDAVRAFLLAATARDANGEVYNLGGDEVVTLRALAELLVDCTGRAASASSRSGRPEGDRHRRLLRRLHEDPRRRSAGAPTSSLRRACRRSTTTASTATDYWADADGSVPRPSPSDAGVPRRPRRGDRGSLDEGRFVGGPAVERFEAAFAAWCGARHAVGVASARDAIAIALRALGVEPGDEVITVANTCVPTVAGIEAAARLPSRRHRRATLTLDPRGSSEAITARTRAIVPVHLYGQLRGPGRARSRTRAHGSRGRGRGAGSRGAYGPPCRSLGDAAAFSFYPTKNLGAIGDGGRRRHQRPRRSRNGASCGTTASGSATTRSSAERTAASTRCRPPSWRSS